MKAAILRFFSSVAVTALMLSAVGCDSGGRRLGLLDSQSAPRQLDAEQKRLQSLQLVRYTDANGNEYFMPTQGLKDALLAYCDYLTLCPDIAQSDTCVASACIYGRVPLCAARYLQSAALLRAEPLKLPKAYQLKASPASDDLEDLGNYDLVNGEVSVPPQSPSARAAILRYALDWTKGVLSGGIQESGGLSDGLTTFTNCPNTGNPYSVGGAVLPWSQGNYAAGLYAEVTVQAYDLLKELSEDTTDAILAAADAQRSLSTTTAQAAARSFAGEQLSRAEAAHLLIGGTPGLLGDTTKAFCSSPELSGRARGALGILRRTAPDPDDVTSTSVGLDLLLDGSIRTRLEVLDGQTISSLLDYTGFSLEDFAQARSYLTQEIRVFARDRSVTFTPETLLPIPSGMLFFRATATEPVAPPPEYFAALARRWDDAGPRRPPGGELQATDVSASLAVAMGRIREAIGLGTTAPYITGLPTSAVTAQAQFQGSLNLLAARDERATQLGWRRIVGGATRFYADGYNAGHKLRIVHGLSGLLCATTGQVEGSPCTSATLEALTAAKLTNTASTQGANNPQVVGRGYSETAWGDDGQPLSLDWSDATPIFLVKPKDSAYEVPGEYDVLGGLQLRGLTETDSNGSIYYRFAIFSELERTVGEILRPSTKWCTRAAVECDGTLFDERLPLENELSDDQDGVESSWRHYLAMAEQAASEAHTLGEQYILNGVEVDRNLESVQLREAADRQRYLSRVEGEMETLQDICGTAMDTTDILGLLGGEAVGPTNGLGCAQADDCCGGAVGSTGLCPYTCSNGLCFANSCVQGDDTACPSPYQCIGQRCVYSPNLRVQDEPSPTEGLSRLRECIGNGTVHDYVALGSVPLCLWDGAPSNPTKICQGATAQYPCPVAARKLSDGTYDCTGRVKPGETPRLVMETLSLVDSSALQDLGEDPCDMLRKARASSNGWPGQPNVVLDYSGSAQLYLTQSFQPPLFGAEHMRHADRIGWRVEPPSALGNVASLLVDNKIRWTTRPGAIEWPCTAFDPADAPDVCVHGSGSLFCDMAATGCSQTTDAQRNAASRVSQRLFAATLVLKGLASGDFQNIVVPALVSAPSVPGLFGSPRGTVDRGAYFEQNFYLGPKRFYDDPAESNPAMPFWRYTKNAWGEALQGIVTLAADQFDVPAGNASSTMFHLPLPSAVGPPAFTIERLLPAMFQANGAPRLTDWLQTLTAHRPLPHGDEEALAGELDSPYLTPHVEYSTENIHDAAELLCEVTRRDPWFREPFSCPVFDMTALTAQGDMRALSEYADCRVDVLNRAVGSLVLSRVPVRVVHALRTFSVTGASPLVGGQMGSSMDRLRASLTRYGDLSRAMADLGSEANDAISDMGLALQELQKKNEIDALIEMNANEAAYIASLRGAQQRLKVDKLEFEKWVILGKAAVDCTLAFAQGASNTIGSLGTSNGVAAAQCAQSVALAGLNQHSLSYDQSIADLEEEIALSQETQAGNDREIAKNNAVLNQLRYAREMIGATARLRSAMSGMAGISTEAQAALEELRASVTDIESLRLKAQRSLMRAMQFETTQAAVTENIESVLNAKLNVSKKRYLQAHDNAVRFAFLAKRAIEQRLGMHLSELRADMPLVDAPAAWEADICAAEGIDYEAVRATATERGESSSIPVDYSGMYIGDYVAKLKDVVESYRLQYDFHEGTDEAIASVRDDILNVRAPCSEPSTNLLHFSGKLDALVSSGEEGGWEIQGCSLVAGEGVSDKCFSVQEATSSSIPGATGFLLSLGNEATAQTRLVQRVKLGAGRHRVSWFTDPNQGLADVTLLASDGAPLAPVVHETLSEWVALSSSAADWPRHYRLYDLDDEQEVFVAIRPVGAAVLYSVGGLMLEELLDSEIGGHPQLQIPGPYVATTDSLEVRRPFCEDKNGEVFRMTSWKYRCTKLCTDGFSDNCLDSSLADRCYWETTFSLDLRDLESGRIFEQSGFARGNFNYRIEDIGVNFVGTELRDCSDSPLPSTCNAAGFVTYSLQHLGPLFVRNHTGGDFPVKLFDGKIEHARGLGIERYLTNPLSSTDRELLTPYMRAEFTGRPLDGNFVLRVWDENGVNFSAIEDVQLYLKYRYWTRFN
jgi:hypothetical protein